jgi:hypothetical protein
VTDEPTEPEIDSAMHRIDTLHKQAAYLCRKMIEETLELELHPKMGILALYHFMRLQVRENLKRGNFDIEDIKMSKLAFDIIAEGHTALEYEVSPEEGIVEMLKH